MNRKEIKKIPAFSLLFIVIAIAICGLIIITKSELSSSGAGNRGILGFTYSSSYNDALMGIIAALTALGLLTIFLVNRYRPGFFSEKVRKAGKLLVVALVVFSAIVYYYGGRAIAKQYYPKFWDSYHYLIGAKYFKELGYNKLYECHLKADSERTQPRYLDYQWVRDLATYNMISVSQAKSKADCSAFSPKRWQEFKSDLDFYDSYNLRKVLEDHGYNGTPFHAFLAGNLANLVPVNYTSVVSMTLLDIVAICVMFALITWAFGWKIGCLFALFYFTNFADRFYYIGASYFRYIWMAALGVGVAFLKKEKYGLAAIFMSASAMLNVFPLLFLSGIGIKAVVQFIKTRKLMPHYKTFIMWGMVASCAFGSLSLLQQRHVHNYKEFFNNMASHSKLLTTSRIGFKYNFLYHGEITSQDRSYSYSYKALEFEKKKVGVYVIVILILIFGFAAINRLDDVSATVLGGFLLFFLLFSTVEYYYTAAAVLVLFWHREIDENRPLPFLALLFGLMGVVFATWHNTRFLKFCNNHAMTMLFTIYVSVVLIAVARKTGLVADIYALLDTYILSKLKGTRLHLTVKASVSTLRAVAIKSWKYMLAGVGLLIVCLLLILLITTRTGPEYTLFASGDSVLARRMHYYVDEKGPRWPVQEVSDIMKKADIAMTNLETVITNSGKMYPKGNRNPYYFRGRPVLVEILTQAGIDFVTTANNHAMDYGPEGVQGQQQILKDVGIAFAGSGKDIDEASRPAFIQVHDVIVAFVSMYIGDGDMIAAKNKAGIFQVNNNTEVLQALQPVYNYARNHAQLVVFSPHWGRNMTKNPTQERIYLARAIINMGFDAIIGHSAHQLHGVEVYKGKPIIYDMGNFVADWVANKRMSRGAVFLLRFNKHGFTRLHILPLKLKPGHVVLAKDNEVKKVKNLIVNLSKRINRKIDFANKGNMLEVRLDPEPERMQQITQPGNIHIINSVKPLPIKYRDHDTYYVRKAQPGYCAYFVPVSLENYLDIIGAKTVETVKTGSCFLLEVALKVNKPLKGQWEVVTTLKKKDGNDQYEYRHPISNGAVSQEAFFPGNIIIDRVCVRSRQQVSEGTYEIFWALYDRRTRKWLLAGNELDGKKPAKIGEIYISEKAQSPLASGIDWNGRR